MSATAADAAASQAWRQFAPRPQYPTCPTRRVHRGTDARDGEASERPYRIEAADLGAFSVCLVLGELVHALVRQSKQSGGITGAHLQAPSAQDTHGSSSRLGGTPFFVGGPPAECYIRPKRPRCVGRQLHLVDNLRAACVGDEQLHRFHNATAGLVNRASLRVTAAYTAH